MSEDYSQPRVLLPFLCRFLKDGGPYPAVAVRLVRDGSLQVELTEPEGARTIVRWVEQATGDGFEVVHGDVVVRALRPGEHPEDAAATARQQRAASHVARRITRLLRGQPPHLLQFRNRNPQTLQWDARLFGSLCPDMLVKGRTRYFDYRVTELDEYEGFLGITFATRKRRVRLRLELGPVGTAEALVRWGPITLTRREDDRTDEERRQPEHQVEEFVGYVLSRNLPPRFSLTFAHRDPPAGYLPPDHNVDFLRPTRLDDSAFFEMLLATDDAVALVLTCDRECFNFFSMVGGPRERWTTATPWHLPPSANLLDHVRWLDLSSPAAVMGTDSLEEVLAGVGAQEPAPELVVSVDSCLAKLVGSDVVGPVERFAARHGLPIVHYDIRLSQSTVQGPLHEFWRELLAALPPATAPSEPGDVVFLGLHPAAAGELTGLLERLGVRPRGNLFPHLELDAVRALREVPVVVANTWSFVRDMFSLALPTLAADVVHLPLPYGLRSCRAWLRQVVEACGGNPDRVDALPEWAPAEQVLAADRAGLAGHRVGLVARARDAQDRLSPIERYGVDLIDMLTELGLGLDLLLFVGPDDPEPTETLATKLGLDLARGDRWRAFHDFRELPELLGRGDFQLVYSEIYRDERISAHGMTPLGLADLEPGLNGALRTARRLRALLSSRFYARYHRFFASPYAHYQHAPEVRHDR